MSLELTFEDYMEMEANNWSYDLASENLENFRDYEDLDESYIVPEDDYSKDRSKARNKHLNRTKAKKRAIRAYAILTSKYKNLDSHATWKQENRIAARHARAEKKAKRFK